MSWLAGHDARVFFESIAMIALVGFAVCEMLTERSWARWHYRNGPVVVRRRIRRRISPERIAFKLEGAFGSMSHRLTAAVISANEVGFYVDGPGNSHIPFVRGHIVVGDGVIDLRGRLSWSAVLGGSALAALMVSEATVNPAGGWQVFGIGASVVVLIISLRYAWWFARVTDRIER